jgi:hypothetical protein
MFTDWERSSRLLVAKFRADSARHLGDPEFETLITALRRTSPEFSLAWDRHEVSQSGEGRKDLRHPTAGMLSFSHAVFHPAEFLEQRLILYSPLPDNDTPAKLSMLLADRGCGSSNGNGGRAARTVNYAWQTGIATPPR